MVGVLRVKKGSGRIFKRVQYLELETRVVWIRTITSIGTLESQKIISVLSYHLIGLVEIPEIEFLPLD